ncbi:MAG: phospholipase A [Gammaproteobacteria bacterium]|jgi:phospholipase A1|nr:phospholipase A [Gammaproteobacteria bacterium]
MIASFSFGQPCRLAGLAIALAIGGGGLAHANPAGLEACAAIASDGERLACYDQLIGRVAKTSPVADGAPVTAPPASPAGGPSAAEAPTVAAASPPSLLDATWAFTPDADLQLIRLYRPNYLQFARYSSNPNAGPFDVLFNALGNEDADIDKVEAKFQVSFKTRLWATEDRRLGVWAAYTQQSWWQVYNDKISRPFRETNYQPEIFVSYQPDLSLGDFRWGLFNFGYNHQSNGRSDPISRSWDRLVAEIGIERGDFALLIRPWLVIHDGGDDNPNITDYLGHGDVTALYKRGEHTFTLMGRGNPGEKKGAAQVTWMSPPVLGPLRLYFDAFTGYGESMIDYNHKQTSVGVGVALNDLID